MKRFLSHKTILKTTQPESANFSPPNPRTFEKGSNDVKTL